MKFLESKQHEKEACTNFSFIVWSKNLVVYWKLLCINLRTPLRKIKKGELMVPTSFKYLLSLIINSQFHKLISGHAILNFTSNVAAFGESLLKTDNIILKMDRTPLIFSAKIWLVHWLFFAKKTRKHHGNWCSF